MSTGQDANEFQIGLVMAGAISAGAYTAGVVDFLFEALDEWEAAKARGEGVPGHKVTFAVMTGASAGAITSAIAAVSVHGETEPVRDIGAPPPARRNRFFDAWVRQIDLKDMLKSRDMAKGHPLASALDSTRLDEIAAEALKVERRNGKRAWVADPLPVFLTVSNLRGVPYSFDLYGSGTVAKYGMMAHKDFMAFSVSEKGEHDPDQRLLKPADAPGGAWPDLAQASLASGAFPGGLRSRSLSRPWEDYRKRDLGEHLSNEGAPDVYDFANVDGGTMDNEPLELARTYLARNQEKDECGVRRNPRSGVEASRAVIMIDPFPNKAELPAFPGPGADVLRDAMGMFNALINQARFKPEELRNAGNSNIFSRFMINPTRSRDGQKVEPAMASAIMGGFGGFLAEDFRRHDFQLGRRNCQRFLQKYFSLPEKNALFDGMDPEARTQWAVMTTTAAGQVLPAAYGADPKQRMMPVIPLVGTAAEPMPAPPPPSARSVDTDDLEKRIRKRAQAVGAKVFDHHLDGVIAAAVRHMAKFYFRLFTSKVIAKRARAWIESELGKLN